DRKAGEDQIEHRPVHAHRLAKVAVQNAAKPLEILDGQRLVETVLLSDLLDEFPVGVFAGQRQGRIARQKALEHEDDHREDEQGRYDLQKPLTDHTDHAAGSLVLRAWKAPKRRERRGSTASTGIRSSAAGSAF